MGQKQERKQEQKQERKQEQRQEQRQEQKQKEERKEERQAFLAAVNKIDPGPRLSTKELEQLTRKSQLTPEEVLRKVEKTTDIKIPTRVSNRATAGNTTTTTTTTVTPGGEVRGADGLTDAERKNKERDEEVKKLKEDNATLFQTIADFNVDIAEIDNKGDLDVATAYADAQKYGYDKEAGWRTDVANIEVKGKLDLQPIINAGLERVADIEGQSARDVAKTTGEYSLKSMETRTEADKSLGKMQLAGSMYGLLSSAFG